MHEDFDEDEFEPAERRRDRILTLGPNLLLFFFFGLVVLCGLCFGLGYSMGSRGSQDSTAAMPQQGTLSALANGLRAKPSATASNIPQAPPQRAVVTLPAPPASGGNPTPRAQSPEPPPAAGANPSSWAVKPALPVQAGQPQPSQPQPGQGQAGQPQQKQPQPAAALPAQASAPPAAKAPPPPPAPIVPLALMVQIAAVSHQEDADVLVSALRKRGYAVAVRREPADSLIHVRIGPFTTHEEANNWRQKLLNDGYNAIVQQ